MTNFSQMSLEIIVAGGNAAIWIGLLIVRIVSPYYFIEDFAIENLSASLSIANVVIGAVLIYTIGWIINFSSETLLDPIFQTRHRKGVFNDEDFYRVRTIVFQYGSTSIINDINFDRHILKVTKNNVVNFFLFTLVCTSFINISVVFGVVGMIVGLFASFLSFFHWKSRYTTVFLKIRDAYDALLLTKPELKG